jgi:hypothetical protein
MAMRSAILVSLDQPYFPLGAEPLATLRVPNVEAVVVQHFHNEPVERWQRPECYHMHAVTNSRLPVQMSDVHMGAPSVCRRAARQHALQGLICWSGMPADRNSRQGATGRENGGTGYRLGDWLDASRGRMTRWPELPLGRRAQG